MKFTKSEFVKEYLKSCIDARYAQQNIACTHDKYTELANILDDYEKISYILCEDDTEKRNLTRLFDICDDTALIITKIFDSSELPFNSFFRFLYEMIIEYYDDITIGFRDYEYCSKFLRETIELLYNEVIC